MSDAAALPPAGSPGLADLVEIFYAPSAVFARRRDGKFGVPYLGLVVVGIAVYLATAGLLKPIIDAQIAQQLAQQVAKNPAQADAINKGGAMMRTLAPAAIIGFYLIGPFLVALLLWIVGKLARVRAIGTTAIVIATFSLYPRILQGIVGAVLALALPESSLTSAAAISVGPARFVDPALHPALFALAGRFDLFLLWSIVLLAIGTRVAAGATRGQAWGTAIGVWAIGLIPVAYAIVKG
jgi:hypothetical protein